MKTAKQKALSLFMIVIQVDLMKTASQCNLPFHPQGWSKKEFLLTVAIKLHPEKVWEERKMFNGGIYGFI